MPSIDEKRVYDTTTGTTRLLVASSVGVVRVSVSDDIVGEFGIDHACTATDIARSGGTLAVATDEDVLVGEYAPTGHGPATAVGAETTRDGRQSSPSPRTAPSPGSPRLGPTGRNSGVCRSHARSTAAWWRPPTASSGRVRNSTPSDSVR